MQRHYRSFLVRAWRVGNGQPRVEVEAIQTGERLSGVPLATALAWLQDQALAAEAVVAARPDEPGSETALPAPDPR